MTAVSDLISTGAVKKVSRGTVAVAGTSVDVTVPAVEDVNKVFLSFQGGCSFGSAVTVGSGLVFRGGNESSSTMFCTLTMLNATTLRISASPPGGAAFRIEGQWQIVEFF